MTRKRELKMNNYKMGNDANKNYDIIMSDTVLRYHNTDKEHAATIKMAIDDFLSGYYFVLDDEIYKARVKAFTKCADKPQYKDTLFALYPLDECIDCYVIYNKAFSEKMAREKKQQAILLVSTFEINLLADDPMADILDKMSNATQVYH